MRSRGRKLTDEQVVNARQMYRDGATYSEIGASFGVSACSTQRLVQGVTYKNVTGFILDKERRCPKKASIRGSLHYHSVLDEDDVKAIKQKLSDGSTQNELAKEFCVSRGSISSISLGRSWAHVGSQLNLDGSRNRKGRTIGSANGMATLDESSVGHIKWHLSIGVAYCLLAWYFKVSKATICRIHRKLTWKHVKPDPNAPPLIFSTERELPIRLRGERLEEAFRERLSGNAFHEVARGLEHLA